MSDRRFEIRTPNARFDGERRGVVFRAGVGVTSDAAAAAECGVLGYAVREIKAPAAGRKKSARRRDNKGA